MIIAKTKLKKIPDKCINCKFCEDTGRLLTKVIKELRMGDYYRQKKCFLTGVEIPYIYNATNHNWEYTKCKSCPLKEVEDD